MATKIDSIDQHAVRVSALASTYMEFDSQAVVDVDESQKIVAFGGGAKR